MLLFILAEKAQWLPAVSVQVTFTKTHPNHIFSWARQDVPVQELQTFPSMMLMSFCFFMFSLYSLCSSSYSCTLWCSLLRFQSPAASESWQRLPVHGDHQSWCQFDVDLNKARPARLDRELLAWISKFWLLVWFLLQALFQVSHLKRKYLPSLAGSHVQGNAVWSSLGILFICRNCIWCTYTCAHALIVNSICTCCCFV